MISVIVTAYNVEEYIEKCVLSIVDQTYTDIEILIINDGSTDATAEICEKLASCDKRIRVWNQSNQGVTAARKKGISLAKGSYIGFVDGDDYVEKSMYESLLMKIEHTEADFVHSGYYQNGIKVKCGIREKDCYQINNIENAVRDCLFERTSKYYMTPSNWSKLFKRELIKSAYDEVPNDVTWGEDLLCICNCIVKAQKIGYIDDAYYHYNCRNDSITNTFDYSNFKRDGVLYERLMDFANRNQCSELLIDIRKFYFSNLIFDIKKNSNVPIAQYRFSDEDILNNKNVIIYGAGLVGRDYYLQLRRYSYCNVIALADKNWKNISLPYCNVSGVEHILSMKFDLLLVAVEDEAVAKKISEELIKYGISKNKILWKRPEYY